MCTLIKHGDCIHIFQTKNVEMTPKKFLKHEYWSKCNFSPPVDWLCFSLDESHGPTCSLTCEPAVSLFEKKHLPQPDVLYVLNPHKTVVGDTRIIIVSLWAVLTLCYSSMLCVGKTNRLWRANESRVGLGCPAQTIRVRQGSRCTWLLKVNGQTFHLFLCVGQPPRLLNER